MGKTIEFGQYWLTRGGDIRYVWGDYPFGGHRVHTCDRDGLTEFHTGNGIAQSNLMNDLVKHLPGCTGFDDPVYLMKPVLSEDESALSAITIERDFYRSLLHECAYNLGPYRDEAYRPNSGVKSKDPVDLKVPALVACLAKDALAFQKLQRALSEVE